MFSPSRAHADEVDDLILGRDAFVNGEYDVARDYLHPLVDIANPSARLAPLVTAARRYDAACLFAQRQEDAARAVLERMLRDDPDARLDQTQYDNRFVRFFNLLLRDLQPELERIRTERVLTRQQAEERRAARESLLRDLLTHEVQVERVPRELTFVPFGVGQFANGQRATGVFFLSAELVFTAACLTTFAWHQSIYPAGGSYNADEFSRAQLAQGLQITNWISAGLLVTTVVAGVVQANVTWQPVRRRVVVPRPMPPELDGVRLMAGTSPDGTGAGATLRLTF